MHKFALLRTQKNEILEKIKELGFDPYNFEWIDGVGEYSQEPAPRLIYKGTDYFFQFDNEEGNHCGSYSPTSESFKGYSSPGKWLKQMSAVKFWLMHLHLELGEPDLWSEIANHQIDGSSFDDSINDPFTAMQYDQIVYGINQVRSYIATNN
ncbi:hypothetical protein [Cohnella sp.]|uniref:hypothetical protein n=1 Tax=Cohnella sp. TaxID=1883426 RepID=UPI003567F897